jgi:hypothetical protein
MAIALAALVFCGVQEKMIAKTHNIARRRKPAAPLRGCFGGKKFATLRFTEGECIME